MALNVHGLAPALATELLSSQLTCDYQCKKPHKYTKRITPANRTQQHTKRKTNDRWSSYQERGAGSPLEQLWLNSHSWVKGKAKPPQPAQRSKRVLTPASKDHFTKEKPRCVRPSPAKRQAPSSGKRQLDPSKCGAEEAAHLSSSSNLKSQNTQRGPSRTGHIHSRLAPWAGQPWRGRLPDAWVGDTDGVIRGSIFKPKQILRG